MAGFLRKTVDQCSTKQKMYFSKWCWQQHGSRGRHPAIKGRGQASAAGNKMILTTNCFINHSEPQQRHNNHHWLAKHNNQPIEWLTVTSYLWYALSRLKSCQEPVHESSHLIRFDVSARTLAFFSIQSFLYKLVDVVWICLYNRLLTAAANITPRLYRFAP